MKTNLRHLRVFLAVTELGSVTQAAERCHVSQPAVTQAIRKLEAEAGTALFERSGRRLYPSEAGKVLAARVRRALDRLDPALCELSPRLRLTATAAQLKALIAMREMENFTRAARRLGVAQPTLHKAIGQMQQEAGRPLFERTSFGMAATRPAQSLVQAARLAFAELEQAEADLAELHGREVGRIVIGAMPLSRSHVLPRAIAHFRTRRATLPIRIVEGPYQELLSGLRRGEIDVLVGALRDPPPVEDVEQEPLFSDGLVLLAGASHPILAGGAVTAERLASYPWVVALPGTPTRVHFERLFRDAGVPPPASIVESGSMILMRELLRVSDHLGCISRLQAEAEITHGLLRVMPFQLHDTARPIGLTTRVGWLPTRAQALFLEDLRAVASAPA